MATAETADGAWTFKRVGFFAPRVTIRRANEAGDLAVYQPNFWSDGALTFNDGTTLRWRATNFWRSSWALIDATDTPILTVRPGVKDQKFSDVLKVQATLEVPVPDRTGSRMSMLACFAMYLVLLAYQDSAAVAGTVAVISAT